MLKPFALLWFTFLAAFAIAHPVEMVTYEVAITTETIQSSLKMGAYDASTLAPGTNPNGDQVMQQEEYEQYRLAVAEGVARNLILKSDGKRIAPARVETSIAGLLKDTSHPLELNFFFEYETPKSGSFGQVEIDPNIFRDADAATSLTGTGTLLPHTIILTVDSCGQTRVMPSMGADLITATVDENCSGTQLIRPWASAATTIDASQPGQEITEGRAVTVGSKSRLFWYFLIQGFEHIVFGWDHVFFVIGLLLLANSLGNLIKVITAFTISHSITLVITAANFMTVNQPAVVEAIIALSIAYVGAENLVRRGKPADYRWLIVFMFGLVHGMGFAGALQENIGASIPKGDPTLLVICLLVFNLGVELGQVLIILLIFPLLQYLRRNQPMVAKTVVILGSIVVLVMGTGWFLDRTFMPGQIPWLQEEAETG